MNKVKLGEIIQFNPSESIKKGTIAKKIAMEKLWVYTKKISGFENTEYSAGPKFRNNDTLLAKITPCLENGKTAFVDILDENEIAFGSSEFIVLRAIENITDANYIYYLARSPKFRNRAIGCMEGTSGRKRVNDKTLQNEEISLPDLITQTAIAKVLSSLDNKIELNNKINKELENLAKTIYEYWFVQNAEESWEKEKLSKYLEIGSGYAFKSVNYTEKGKYKIITIKNVQDNFLDLSTVEKIDEIPENIKNFCILNVGDALMSLTGNVGRMCIVDSENLLLNQRVGKLLVKDRLYFIFLYLLLSSKEQRNRLEKIAGGSSQANLSPIQALDVFVIIPTISVLQKFNKTVSPIFEQIIKNRQENAELAQQRDFLLPLLMNGQVKIKIV